MHVPCEHLKEGVGECPMDALYWEGRTASPRGICSWVRATERLLCPTLKSQSAVGSHTEDASSKTISLLEIAIVVLHNKGS